MTRILHIIQVLSRGGAARAMCATSKCSARLGAFQHRVLSLLPVERAALELTHDAGMSVVSGRETGTINREIGAADIVHVHYWNNPEMNELLHSELPVSRILIWFHIAGDRAPQIITENLIDIADFAIPCNPYSYSLPVVQVAAAKARNPKTAMVYDAADFERLTGLEPKAHRGFNVGYIGTVDFVKMHPRFVAMSAALEIPDIRIMVCGGGFEKLLELQARQIGAEERFDFRGYVSDIRSVLEVLDVYGYPLCQDTYAAAELNLQEVMYAGIPPVVFPYGGIKSLVEHEKTGLIVNNEREYKEAIEYLFYHPEHRARLGKGAQTYAREVFGAENAARALNPIYQGMMKHPRRERVWGCTAGVPILEQRIAIEDLTDPGRQVTGAALFVESLGDRGDDFQRSMHSLEPDQLFAAEERIAECSPLLRSGGSGGIIHYRCFYPQDPLLRLWTALVLKRTGDFQRAAEEFEAAREYGLSHWRVDWYLAQCAKGRNDFENARILLATVLAAAPDFLPAREALDAVAEQVAGSGAISELLDTVNQHIREGNVKKASEVLEEALRIQPDNADLQGFHGSLLFQLGEYTRARACFQRVVEVKPKEASFRVQMALACREMGDVPGFEAAVQGALAIDPGCRDALKALADFHLQKERFRDSAALYRKILERTPDDIETLLPLGVCFFKLGDLATTETVFRRILELAPENQMAAENLEAVELARAVKKL